MKRTTKQSSLNNVLWSPFSREFPKGIEGLEVLHAKPHGIFPEGKPRCGCHYKSLLYNMLFEQVYIYRYIYMHDNILFELYKSNKWKYSRSKVKPKVPERFISPFFPTNLFFPVASKYWWTKRFLGSPFRNFSLPVEKTLICLVLDHKLLRFGQRCP